ncbi:ATP-binding protein [Streptomyces sp. 4N509B]|uniref:ATP-binding protein n=1 Tax=Streptomyces sp. 4N509B TaxID=3457413 RepID=UPI003FD31636
MRGFVNREEELAELDAVLTTEDGRSLVVSVCVIAGTAGVGKTSLAVRWAHQVRERFPDGQLYVNLRGYDPGRPVTADEALYQFLSALHVPSQAIPADRDARAALYRSYLADRRMLVVLDNANSASQVRPLLPGSVGSLVVVTSRSRLSGLVVRDGARRITLGTLAEPEAVALLRVVTAGYRAHDDQERLEELARLCARLPLALRIAAERAASHPHMRLEDLIAALRDESALWSALSADDDEEADAMATVFAWSYRALPQEAAELFRALGLHPGPAFHTGAAAALAGVSLQRARHLLDVLEGAHLLDQTGPERHEFHDLLRAYAGDQAQQEMTREERAAALRRVLEWYLHTARAAQERINAQVPRIPLDDPVEGVTPLSFENRDEAARWYQEERPALLAAVRAAEEAGWDRLAWQLPAVLRAMLMRFNPFDDWLAMGEIGLRAARREGDRGGEAELLDSLGLAHLRSHRLDEAAEHFEACLVIRRELGDRLREALTLNGLGLVLTRQRGFDAATEMFGQALTLLEELGSERVITPLENLATVHYEQGDLDRAESRVREAVERHAATGGEPRGNPLRILSAVQRERGDAGEAQRTIENALAIASSTVAEGYWLLDLGAAQRANGLTDEALVSYQRSAVIHRRLGDRSREARAWQGVGETYRAMGRFEEAADFHRTAARAQRELGDRWQLALALDGLARALLASEEREGEEAAREHWREALRALEPFDDARAARLRETVRAALEGRRPEGA